MRWMIWMAVLCAASAVMAQSDPFLIDDLRIITRVDVYGIEEQVLIGHITNTSSEAFETVTLMGDVLDADGQPIGEVFGYTVNACGVALLDDPLQPEERAAFALPVDWFGDFDPADLPTRFAIRASGVPTTADRDLTPNGMRAVTAIAADEVVAVDWVADDVLLYGVGCERDLFTSYEWRRYDLLSGSKDALASHPNATYITSALIDSIGVQVPSANQNARNPALLERSALTVIPNSTRIVWQNDRNDLFSANRETGLGRRLIHRYLHQYSLRGFLFTPENNLLAYYFGAHGEPVRYLTASAEGRLISNVITVNPPSNTVPGVWYDGQRVVISGTFDGVTGYFNQQARGFTRELLFEVAPEDLPGNHYPAPAYFRRDLNTRYLYIIRPLDGQAWLQCYHYEGRALHDLTPLPLQLATDERAWSWLSPDGAHLAVAANGRHAGLWLVDLTAFDACPVR
ncbi:hypothetical protein VZO05_00070 [Aggregatilineales bacterium SYSU G02658]